MRPACNRGPPLPTSFHGFVLFFPAAHVADRAVALDALDLERRADQRPASPVTGIISRMRRFAAPGIVAREVLEIGARLDDEELVACES